MENILLPHDFMKGKRQENIIIFPYLSTKSSLKTRFVLDCHLFSFLQKGTKTVSYASGTETITPNSFFFLPSGNCLMSEKAADNGTYQSLLLFVHKKALNVFFEKHTEYTSENKLHNRFLAKHPISIEKDSFIINFIESLEIIFQNRSFSMPVLCELKFEELMLYLIHKSPQLIEYFKSLCDEWEEDTLLKHTIEKHTQSAITVDELAFLCNMSVSTFKRKFTKVFNDSPKQWLLKKRMQQAESMLRENGLKASEIYETLGYENLSSFIQAFKLIYGVTPKQYQLSLYSK